MVGGCTPAAALTARVVTALRPPFASSSAAARTIRARASGLCFLDDINGNSTTLSPLTIDDMLITLSMITENRIRWRCILKVHAGWPDGVVREGGSRPTVCPHASAI